VFTERKGRRDACDDVNDDTRSDERALPAMVEGMGGKVWVVRGVVEFVFGASARMAGERRKEKRR